MDVNSRRKTTSSKLARISHFFNFGKTLALVLFGMLLAVVLVSGCSGTVGSTQATNPPQLTYKISGTITPAAGGSGATVTLSGASTGTQLRELRFRGVGARKLRHNSERGGVHLQPDQPERNPKQCRCYGGKLHWRSAAGAHRDPQLGG